MITECREQIGKSDLKSSMKYPNTQYSASRNDNFVQKKDGPESLNDFNGSSLKSETTSDKMSIANSAAIRANNQIITELTSASDYKMQQQSYGQIVDVFQTPKKNLLNVSDSTKMTSQSKEKRRFLLKIENQLEKQVESFQQENIKIKQLQDIGLQEVTLPSSIINQETKDLPSILQKANNNKLYQTMRAYNIKKIKKQKSSCNNISSSQNTEDYAEQDACLGSVKGQSNQNTSQQDYYRSDQQQQQQQMRFEDSKTNNFGIVSCGGELTTSNTTNNTERNSEQQQQKQKKNQNSSNNSNSKNNQEDSYRLNSKGQMKRQPSQGTLNSIGVNVLKFPPGFFGDDPFKIIDGRMSRKKSKERNSNINNNDQQLQQQQQQYNPSPSQASHYLHQGELPKILEMPVLKEIGSNGFPQIKGKINLKIKNQESRESSQEESNQKNQMLQQQHFSNLVAAISNNSKSSNKYMKPTLIIKDKPFSNKSSPCSSTDSKNLGILQKLQIQKVASENNLKKLNLNQNIIIINKQLPQVLQNNKKVFFMKNTAESSQGCHQLGFKFNGANLKLMSLSKEREASQRQTLRNGMENEIDQNGINRQQSAPMPIEGLQIKVKEECFKSNEGSQKQRMIPNAQNLLQNNNQQFNLKLLKNKQKIKMLPKLESINRQVETQRKEDNFKDNQNLSRAIEQNKFLSRIQSQAIIPSQQQVQANSTYQNQLQVTVDEQNKQFASGILLTNKINKDFKNKFNPNKIIKKESITLNSQVLKNSNSSSNLNNNNYDNNKNTSNQITKPAIVNKISQDHLQKNENNFNNNYNSAQIMTETSLIKNSNSQNSINAGKIQMLTTFGPSLMSIPKLSFPSFIKQNELGNTCSIINREESQVGNDDVEMTFGMIGSHNGNTSVSNASMRQSQYQYMFGSTMRQSYANTNNNYNCLLKQ